MRKITEYRIQEYLDKHNMAFFVKMGVPDAPSIIELKMLPLIDFDNAFPLAAAEKRPPSDMEIRQFAVENLAAVLRQNLFMSFDKKDGCINTVIIGNLLFSEVLFINEPGKAEFEKIKDSIKEYEFRNSCELEDNIKLFPYYIGVMKKRL